MFSTSWDEMSMDGLDRALVGSLAMPKSRPTPYLTYFLAGVIPYGEIQLPARRKPPQPRREQLDGIARGITEVEGMSAPGP